MTETKNEIEKFVGDQLSRWPLACANFRALKSVKTRRLTVGGPEVTVQHNPARMISSAAKLDKESVARRPCFFCNRFPEQTFIRFDGRKGKKYDILLNPYPIFPDHLVIAMASHCPQSIWNRYIDILDLSRKYPDYTFFYNGPHSGASAPDHHHFQAAPNGLMPLENDVRRLLLELETEKSLEYLTSMQDARLYHYRKFVNGVFVLSAPTSKSAAKLFYRLLDCADVPEGESEPLFNLISWYSEGEYRSVVVFRTSHRSHHYFSDGPDHLTMSPGCADMGGCIIAPVPEDFEKLDDALLGDLLTEVTLTEQSERKIIRRLTRVQPHISVGIMSAERIEFKMYPDGGGTRAATFREGKIDYDGALYDELFFEEQTPSTSFAEPTFELHGVTIGKGFHWERTETQTFAGALKIIVENGRLTAINVVGVEDYLLSVISSEMSQNSPLEFLKAHAVISRSWVTAQIRRSGESAGDDGEKAELMSCRNVEEVVSWLETRRFGRLAAASGTESAAGFETVGGYGNPGGCGNIPGCENQDGNISSCENRGGNILGSENTREREYVKWYDHNDHRNFDVCADDHCQRYQGLTRAVNPAVQKAVDETWGQILCYGGELCDARFSKCCGGVTELFSTCWADTDKPYLPALPDTPGHLPEGECPDSLQSEHFLKGHSDSLKPGNPAEAGRSGPLPSEILQKGERVAPFCAGADSGILARVFNSYDRETEDFYRWTQKYSVEELSALIEKKSGLLIGRLEALDPLETGPSGRISKLRIKGSEGGFIVGKELEIRRLLSPSHLKSSAFTAEFAGGDVILRGRGWGHGVGLCQIGAAVMSVRGYGCGQILEHYYPGTEIAEQW